MFFDHAAIMTEPVFGKLGTISVNQDIVVADILCAAALDGYRQES